MDGTADVNATVDEHSRPNVLEPLAAGRDHSALLEEAGVQEVEHVDSMSGRWLLMSESRRVAFRHGPNLDDKRRKQLGTPPDVSVGPRALGSLQQFAIQHEDVVRFEPVPLAVSTEPRAI